MAARKRVQVVKPGYALVRGAGKPVVMASNPRKGPLARLAKMIQSHFPGRKVRVVKNPGGFVDGGGVFHPLRNADSYDYGRAGEKLPKRPRLTAKQLRDRAKRYND